MLLGKGQLAGAEGNSHHADDIHIASNAPFVKLGNTAGVPGLRLNPGDHVVFAL